MTREQLSEALGEISPSYVEEALSGETTHTARRPKELFRTGLAAAMIAGLLIITAGAVFLLKPVVQTYLGTSSSYVYQKAVRS